jgi:diguanylate cyclase (GGDEF)-like protein
LEQETKIYKTFVVSTSIAIVLILSAVFLCLSFKTRSMIHEQLLSEARAHFDTMVKARAWNARYGGVYVEKKEGVRSNPYIEHPDIETTDGRVFTIRNPAMMTREISSLFGMTGKLTYRITSLRPVNPLNRPDEFERAALESFERGVPEVSRIVEANGMTFFRYMAPLRTEQSCLLCHAKHGYKVGDIRGGIAVTFDVGDIEKRLTANLLLMIAAAAATIILLLLLVRHFTNRLMNKIAETRQRIEEMAVTDDLTQISNRRYIISKFEEEMERARRLQRKMCCLMLDIDYFKAINDRHGHQFGDDVLKEIAERISGHIRKYDTAGRYGGEEFMVVLPETDLNEAAVFAERVRGVVKEQPIKGADVTVSIGVAQYREADASVDDVIKRADEALYRAKETGRDRVVVEGTPA